MARRALRFGTRRFARINPRPVIVLGNHKSGTTAIAALLAKIAGESVSIDPFYRVRPGADESLRDYVRAHRWLFAAGVIKDPNFTFLLPELHACFPAARYVFIARDPRDNARSILNRLDLPGDHTALTEPVRQRLDSSTWGWMFREAGGNGWVHDYLDVLIDRWLAAARAYLRHSELLAPLRYEDFVRDKAGTISNLARAVDLEPRRDIQRDVDVQYQPAGDNRLSWPEFFGERNLERIESRCAREMSALGYEVPDRSAPRSCSTRTTSRATGK